MNTAIFFYLFSVTKLIKVMDNETKKNTSNPRYIVTKIYRTVNKSWQDTILINLTA